MNAKLAQRYHNDGMAVTPRPQLVVMLYERLLLDLRRAARATATNQIEVAHDNLVHGQSIVYELSLALDVTQWDGGPGLLSLYDHLEERMVKANLEKSTATINECITIVEPLVDAWRQALLLARQDRAAASPRLDGSVSA